MGTNATIRCIHCGTDIAQRGSWHKYQGSDNGGGCCPACGYVYGSNYAMRGGAPIDDVKDMEKRMTEKFKRRERIGTWIFWGVWIAYALFIIVCIILDGMGIIS